MLSARIQRLGDVPVALDLILIVLLAVLVLALMGDRWL
jgi:hypothetical protein